MTPERWAQIEELFHRAAESDPQHRITILDEACRNDSELRGQVEALLSSDKRARSRMQAAVRSEFAAATFSLTGKTVSHYHVLDGVGGGGMGLVYQAEDIRLGRRVALKFLPEDSAKDPAALVRFEREARSASALEHSNICPIYEFGEHEGQPFLVMPLLEGQTLQELLSEATKKGLELSSLLDLAIQILGGLGAAHRQGIIHRDIKPANIFVTSQGQAKILDFGLAKLAMTGAVGENEFERELNDCDGADRTPGETVLLLTTVPFLSRTGVAMGTAGYMSPEQVRGQKLDARTDLFSFGLVLYEIATGKRAFTGDTGLALQAAILTQTPSPVREVNPRLPARLDGIINKALQKDPDARYQTASEMRSDLETLKFEIAPKLPPRWRLAVGLAALLFVSAIFWFSRRPPASHQAVREFTQRQLTVNSSENRVTGGAISPDGKYLVYTDPDGIHLKRMETGETHSVRQPEIFKEKSPIWEIGSWLPDSKHFFAIAELPEQPTTLWSFSVVGAVQRKLAEDAEPWGVSRDGSLLAFTRNNHREIWLIRTNGENARKLYQTEKNSQSRAVQWSPNGKRLAYIRTRLVAGKDESQIEVRDVKGGPATVLLSGAAMRDVSQMDEGLRDLKWLSDGRLIFVGGEPDIHGTSCNLWEVPIDNQTGRLLGPPQRFTNWSGFCVATLSHTADNKKLVFTRSSDLLAVYAAEFDSVKLRLTTPRRLTFTDDLSSPTGWTPDSKAVLIKSNREGSWAIYKQPVSGGAAESVVTGLKGVSWSTPVTPDGKWILYDVYDPSEPNTPVHSMRVSLSGGAPEQITRSHSRDIICPRSSRSPCVICEMTPDKNHLTFTALDALKGPGRELATFSDEHIDQFGWDLSPDGRRIALFREFERRFRLLSLDQQSAVQQIDIKGGAQLRTVSWAADAKGLFVSSAFQQGEQLLYVDLKGTSRPLWRVNGVNVFLWGRPSPDGRHLAIQSRAASSNMWMIENF